MAVSDWCAFDNRSVLVVLTVLYTARALRAPVKL